MRRLAAACAAAALLALGGCGQTDPDVVDARRHDAFWLWSGVRPQPALAGAKTLYLLDGEILAARPDRYVDLRPGVPRLPDTQLWLVVRTDTLAWPRAALPALVARLERWAAAGNRVEGLQLDFDAATRGLDAYAAFLREIRRGLPARYRLSITGLMDWSANGDPAALAALSGTIDEAVIQTYRGRATIPGYEAYFRRMRRFPLPFRVGLVQGGEWRAPPGLAAEPNFRGYVVFLLNPPG
ncbi:MAG: hypothetical protein QOI38_1450 [Sphingomonadales bacterium]|nr:hypothetical protein [Sphingomonadales bacterium]